MNGTEVLLLVEKVVKRYSQIFKLSLFLGLLYLMLCKQDHVLFALLKGRRKSLLKGFMAKISNGKMLHSCYLMLFSSYYISLIVLSTA